MRGIAKACFGLIAVMAFACGNSPSADKGNASVSNGSGGGAAGNSSGSSGDAGQGSSGGDSSNDGQGGAANAGGTMSMGGTSGEGGSAPEEQCTQSCRTDQVCNNGACECPATTEECDGVCVDTTSNPAYCGTCTNACDTDLVCDESACVDGCGNTKVNCDGACVDPATSAEFCGAGDDCFAANRGEQCRIDQECSGGQCRCPSGEQECGGKCVSILSDPEHCGACDTSCGSGGHTEPVCANGTCGCTSGWENCDSVNDCESQTNPGYTCGICYGCLRQSFVTSEAFTGNLGGIQGANAKCMAAIGALSGNWVAWISDDNSSASDNLVHGTAEYRNNFHVLANNWDDFTDGNLGNTFFASENETAHPMGTRIWTGTTAAGDTVQGANCDNWTSTQGTGAVGVTHATDAQWSYANAPSDPTQGLDPCNEERHLICIAE